jgi:DNA-directed RNA polymerase subunit RPC12/RpoP
MKKDDVACSECGAGFRRLESPFVSGAEGEYHCPACGELLEKFDGSKLIASRSSLRSKAFESRPPQLAASLAHLKRAD